METILPTPGPDEAAADLNAVADAQRTVRDRRWPVWLYPANAVLLAAMALTPLLPEPGKLAAWVVLGLGVFMLNYAVGRLIGTPFTIPTSRGFLAGVAVATVFLVAALAIGLFDVPTWVIVACAAGTAISYGIGSVLHYRSTRS